MELAVAVRFELEVADNIVDIADVPAVDMHSVKIAAVTTEFGVIASHVLVSLTVGSMRGAG